MIIKRSMIMALLSTVIALLASPVNAATLLPPGKQCLSDENGSPLAAGTINFYIPATTTPKSTYQDSASTILNTNPVLLDSAGCAIIYGDGTYREIVKDSLGNLIWDQLTASTGNQTGVILYGGTSSGSANAQAVTVSGFTATDGQLISFIAGLSNTGATTIDAGTGGIAVRYDSSTGPVALTGNEIRANNVVIALYTSGFFHLIGPPVPIQYQTTSDYQAFTTSGTWTKPGFATVDTKATTFVQCWGDGGGGGANATGGGGGGGAYNQMTFLTSALGATETVAVGTGGAINASGSGTFFGTAIKLYAWYGCAGQNGANGGGGGGGNTGINTLGSLCSPGAGSAGGVSGHPFGNPGGTAGNPGIDGNAGSGGGSTGDGGDGLMGGGGGGGGAAATSGGASIYGGGGGGGSAGVGGNSSFGGNGGGTAQAGFAPGGGGGRNAAGARGECRIRTTP